jgi:hypothetical protein
MELASRLFHGIKLFHLIPAYSTGIDRNKIYSTGISHYSSLTPMEYYGIKPE